MPRYHVNPETQRPNICRATEKRGCLYKSEDGTEPPHFPTKEAAKAWVEEDSAREAGGSFSSGLSKNTLGKKKLNNKDDATPVPSEKPRQALPPLTEEYLEELALATPHPLPKGPRELPMPDGMSSIHGEIISLDKVKKAMDEYNTSGDMLYEPGSLRVMHWSGSLTVLYRDANNGDSMIYQVNDDGNAFLRNEPDEDYRELVDHVIAENFPGEDSSSSPSMMRLSTEERAVKHIFELADRIDAKSQEQWEADAGAVATSYLGEGHAAINDALRDGTASQALLNSLDAFSKEHVLEEDTVVYRGLRKMGEDDARASVDNERRGLLSTSTNAATAINFSGNREGSTVMRMLLPKGTRCRIVGGYESEIILPRDAELENVEMLHLTRRLKTRG